MSLILEELSYLSADGVTTVHGVIYTDSRVKPRGIVQVSHGLCEYMGRYESFASYFTARGFIVCGNDHLGHGRTLSTRGLGFFSDKDGDYLLIEDVHRLTDRMKEKYPTLPYFLYGHSMGSFIAGLYLTSFDEYLTGVILSGTGGRSWQTGPNYLFATLMTFLQGGARRNKMMHKLAFGHYNRRYDDHRTDFDWISSDTAVVDAYMQDELCTFLPANRCYKDICSLMRGMSRGRWALSISETLPVLLLAGDMDPVGHYGKGVKEVADRLTRSGVTDVTLKLYKDGRHEMHNEKNREQVLADVLDWMLWKMKKKRK